MLQLTQYPYGSTWQCAYSQVQICTHVATIDQEHAAQCSIPLSRPFADALSGHIYQLVQLQSSHLDCHSLSSSEYSAGVTRAHSCMHILATLWLTSTVAVLLPVLIIHIMAICPACQWTHMLQGCREQEQQNSKSSIQTANESSIGVSSPYFSSWL